MANVKVIDRADLEAAKAAILDTITKKREVEAEPGAPRDVMLDILTEVLEKLNALTEKVEAAEKEGQPLTPDDLTPEEVDIVTAGGHIRHSRFGALLGVLDSLLDVGGNGADGG